MGCIFQWPSTPHKTIYIWIAYKLNQVEVGSKNDSTDFAIFSPFTKTEQWPRPWLLAVYWGWNTTQLYSFFFHKPLFQDPYQPTRIQWNVKGGFWFTLLNWLLNRIPRIVKDRWTRSPKKCQKFPLRMDPWWVSFTRMNCWDLRRTPILKTHGTITAIVFLKWTSRDPLGEREFFFDDWWFLQKFLCFRVSFP